MKYCINYNKKSHILDTIDEINVFLDRVEDNTALSTFCDEHINQRINICIKDVEKALSENKVKDLLDLQKEHSNLYIRFEYIVKELKEMLFYYPNSKYYFNIKINDWDRVIGLIDYGVSDIFIVEGLGFELDKIAEIAHNSGVQVRVYPNVAQSAWQDLDDLRKFWIRPNDISEYEPYVDVCEFYGLWEDINFDVLYDIYKSDKVWFGKLSEIISGLNQEIDNRYIVPRFVKKRIRCCRQCMKGSNCQMCDHILDLSSNLEKAGLIVTMEEEEK